MADQSAPRQLAALPIHGQGPTEPSVVRVGGHVAHPLVLTAGDLAGLPRAEVTDDFVCREGWCVPGLHWEGIALSTLLQAAGAAATAGWVEVAAGSFSTSLSRADADRALIATHLGGELLAPEHGGPARLIIPGADCYTSIKWVDRIDVRAQAGPDSAREVALARLDRPAR